MFGVEQIHCEVSGLAAVSRELGSCCTDKIANLRTEF